MQVNDAIRAIVQASGLSLRGVSERMGKKPTLVSSALQNKDKQASLLAGIAAACGYDLALVPKGKAPEGTVIIDSPTKGAENAGH